MASEWFYTMKGEKHGPVSSQELRRLAQAGTLARTDLLWKEGMKDWRPASEAQKLFDDDSSSDAGSAKTEASQTASAPTSVEAPNSSKVVVSLGARMQNAARATALKAEQTKLQTVSLPAAYIKLGKHLHSNRLLMEQFPDLYQQIDALQAKAADASRKAAEATGTNFTEKAKALAQKGAELAKSKAAEVQQLAVFKQLGEAAYEGITADSIEAERLVDIVTIRKRVAAISETLMVDANAGPGSLDPAPSAKSDGGSKWPWKRRLKWVGGSIAALYLVGLVFGSRKEDAHQGSAPLQGRQTASSVTRSETADATLGANAATGGQGDSTSSENQVNQYLRDMRDGYADQQRANVAQAQQMREETSRKMQEEERVAREQQAKWRKKHEEEQAVRERQQREEQANLDAMRKQPTPSSVVAATPPRAERNYGKPLSDNNMLTVWPSLTTTRHTKVDMTKVFEVKTRMTEGEVLSLLGEPHETQRTLYKSTPFMQGKERETETWTYRGDHKDDFIMIEFTTGHVTSGGSSGWDFEKGFIGTPSEKKRIIEHYQRFIKDGGKPPFDALNPPEPGGT